MSAAVSLAAPALRAHGLVRELGGKGVARQTILHGITLEVGRGEFVALTGPSGSGKSTLLYLLGCLDRPTRGEVWIDGIATNALRDDDRAQLRREYLGYVFQFHFLLAEFSVLENVVLPMIRRGVLSRRQAEERAYASLAALGLGDLYARRPGQLSGGEQQRVSIARAVANEPLIVLADEPTGNLDSKSAEIVFEVFSRLVREDGRTVVMVTHDPGLAGRTDRQVRLRDGTVIEDAKQRGA